MIQAPVQTRTIARWSGLVLWFILLIAVAFSCGRREELPPYVVDREKMIEVMADMQLVEAALSAKQSAVPDIWKIAPLYYDSLFAKHQVSRAVIDSSIAYYMRRPEMMQKIYADLIIALSKLQPGQAEEITEQPDSLEIVR